MRFDLQIWRQAGPGEPGKFVSYPMDELSPDMSMLEVLDLLNERLTEQRQEPVAFESDCREGICGSCAMMICGVPHGPPRQIATCQLHMREFKDGQTIWIEPFRATAFKPIKDLVVDRSALDRIIQAGGYIAIRTGSAGEANATPVPKVSADTALDASSCIGCGACVAVCPNGSAMLFTAAKISHLGILPQGQAERFERVVDMVAQMDREGFGGCTNHGACENACPKGISAEFIARMNRDLLRAMIVDPRDPPG